jgi:hypothetical protein
MYKLKFGEGITTYGVEEKEEEEEKKKKKKNKKRD